jgi:hypothetical protein
MLRALSRLSEAVGELFRISPREGAGQGWPSRQPSGCIQQRTTKLHRDAKGRNGASNYGNDAIRRLSLVRQPFTQVRIAQCTIGKKAN